MAGKEGPEEHREAAHEQTLAGAVKRGHGSSVMPGPLVAASKG